MSEIFDKPGDMLGRWTRVERALEDAQCYLLGDTPEVGTHEDAREATLDLVREALLTDLPMIRKAVGWYERARHGVLP